MQIRSIQPLQAVESTKMEELYCAENKIAAIEGISHLCSLSILELGSNRIKVRTWSASLPMARPQLCLDVNSLMCCDTAPTKRSVKPNSTSLCRRLRT